MSNRQPWARTTLGVTLFAVAAIAAITGAVSYEHEYQLARHHGQTGWVSTLLPFTVDGMIVAASVVLVWAASVGLRRPWRPLAVLLVGISATIAANLAAGVADGWLGAVVSAWGGVSLILASDLPMWLTGALRKVSGIADPQPASDCSCPPPPVTLAEALPLARAELRRRGEPAGEQALADRFGTNRNQVRKGLAAPVVAGALDRPPVPLPPLDERSLANGDGAHE